MSIDPNSKDRDFTQVLKESYDVGLNRLKVEALISDGVDALVINPDGSANVREMPTAASFSSPLNSTSVAYENSRLVKASAGTLYGITGYNSSNNPQFIQIHDSSTLPIDTAVPKVIFLVQSMSNFSFFADKFGRFFSNGIVICNSSTGPTKTIGASDCWFDVQYQ